MKKFILGKKLEMSQVFAEDGTVVPVTVVEAGPVEVTELKTLKKDGYEAIQVRFGKTKREFKSSAGSFEKGQEFGVSVFEPGDIVKVAGISKGKGFQGVVKRHGFHGAPKTHGTKHAHRQPGSIGATWPQRVLKGTRMAGHMGSKRVTVRNLEIVKVDKEHDRLWIKGAVPGARGSLLEIKG